MKDGTKVLVGIGLLYLFWPKNKNGIGAISDKVDDLYTEAMEAFKAAGYTVAFLDNSTSAYGHSRYFKVYPPGQLDYAKKVRVSDHSVENIIRMQTELLINRKENIKTAIDDANMYFFGKVREIPEIQEVEVIKKYLLPGDEVIKERQAKTGNTVYTVKRTVIKKEYYIP